MAKQPTTIGSVVITKGPMLTAEQFFARQEKRRGTRKALDEALSWARWALNSDLAPMVRATFDAYRALVLKALADDPLGIIPASPEVEEACRWLSEIGNTARSQTETMRHAEAETSARVEAERERGAARLKRVKKETAERVEAETIERQRKEATAKATATKKLNVKARHELIRKLCGEADVPIETPKIADWLAEKTGVSVSTTKTDLRTLRAEPSFLPEK